MALKRTVFLHVVWRCIVLATLVGTVRGFTSGNETALRTALFNPSQYDVSVRPDVTTIVSLTLVPTSLNSIDIKAQTMSISGWWVLSWQDSRLTWNPSAYDGITETHVFEDEVWTPTIVVFNSVNDLSAIDEDTIPVRILSTGQLEWSPPSILTVSCNTDVTHFPFDTQICGVSVKTFGYTLQQLELEADSDEIDLTYYSVSGEWTLLDSWTQKTNLSNYSQVTFNFKFERKPEFYGMNLIMPVLIMALMGLFSFMLPADSGEKMGYSLTVMLTFVVLMTLVADRMPSTTDHTSFFEVYIVLMLTMCALSVVLNIFSLKLHFKNEAKPVPAKVQALVRLLIRLMCQQKHNQTSDDNQMFVASSHVRIQSPTPQTGKRTELSSAARESATTGERHPQQQEPEVTWKKVSTVMDSFCFRLYCFLFVVLTVVFLGIVGFN